MSKRRLQPVSSGKTDGSFGPDRTINRLNPLIASIRSAFVPALALALSPNPVLAGPTGGVVSAGEGLIRTPNAVTTNISQYTQNLAIDWKTFNLAAEETVRFFQPSSTATALNRIHDQNPSQIFGSILANGNVILLNASGVFFSPTATVNVNSLVASSLNITNEDFLAGNYIYQAPPGQEGGLVVNQGVIQAATGGSVTLMGGAVRNEGLILAHAGQVNLVAGNQVTVDFDGDGLMQFAINKEVLGNGQNLSDAVQNTGTIEANGGQVLLKGKAAADVFTNVVNNSGVITAGRIDNQGGVIKLVAAGGSGSVLNTGTLNADAADGTSDGGSVVLRGGNVTQAGTVTANSSGGNGGTIRIQSTDMTLLTGNSTTSATSTNNVGGTAHVLGNLVGLLDMSSIDVSGALGGGEVLVGGDFHGNNPYIQNASRTYVGVNTTITADATENGDGGKVIIWSDESTKFFGNTTSRGGTKGGDGGFIEVSSKDMLAFNGITDTSAPNGLAGTLLLDPTNINIQATATDNTQLDVNVPAGQAAGTILFADACAAATCELTAAAVEAQTGNIILQATSDITVNATLNLTNQTSGERVVFQAGDSITVNNSITTSGADIWFEADSFHSTSGAANGTGTLTVGANIDSNGGDITLMAAGTKFAINANIQADAGDIFLSTSDQTAIALVGDITQNGLNRLLSTGTVTIGQATTAGDDGLGTNSKVRTASSITIADDITISGNTGSTIKLVTTGNIDLTGDNDDLITNQATVLIADFDANGSGTLLLDNKTNTIVTNDHTLDITANDINITATGNPGLLSSGTAAMTITDSDGSGIGLGAAVGLNISDNELGRITASSLTLTTAGSITVDGITGANSTNVNSVTLNAGGNITFSGAASTFDSLTANADGNITVSKAISTTVGGLGLFVDTGDDSAATLKIDTALTGITGSLTLSGGGTGTSDTIDIDADVTAASTLTIKNATTVDLAGDVDLTATNGDLTANSNVGVINLSGAGGTTNKIISVGNFNVALAPITDTSNPNLTVTSDGGITLAGADLGTGTHTFTADISGDSTSTLQINGSLSGGAITLSGGGTGTSDTIDIDADVTAASTLTIKNAATVDLAGDVDLTATNGDLTANSNVGVINLSGAGGTTNKIISVGNFNVALAPITDTSNPNLIISTVAGTLTLDDITLGSGDLTLIGDEINLGGLANSVSGIGNLLIEPGQAGTTVGINDAGSTLDLSTTDLDALADGFTSITIGRSDSGLLTVGAGGYIFSDPLMIHAGSALLNGDLNATTLTGDVNDVTVDMGSGGILADGLVISATGATFTINTGGGNDIVNINDITSGAGILSISGGESVDITTFGTINLNTQGGDDKVTVGIANLYNATFTALNVDGGGQTTSDMFIEDFTGTTSVNVHDYDQDGNFLVTNNVSNADLVTSATNFETIGAVLGTKDGPDIGTPGSLVDAINITSTDPTSGDSTFEVSVSVAGDLIIKFYSGVTLENTISGTYSLATIESVTANGETGFDDVLSIDYANFFDFNDIFTAFNLMGDGGAGSDQLVLNNTGGGLFDVFGNLTLTHTNSDSGTINLTGFNSIPSAEAALINFSGTETITNNVDTAILVINLPVNTKNNDATLTDPEADPDVTLIDMNLLSSASNDFADFLFKVPLDAMSINLGDQGDTLTLTSSDDTVITQFTINGGAGTDTVNVGWTTTPTFRNFTINLISPDIINLNSNITAVGSGGNTGNVSLSGTVILGTDAIITTSGGTNNVLVSGTIDGTGSGTESLTINSGGGVNLLGDTGAGKALNLFTVSASGQVDLMNVTANNISVTGSNIDLNGTTYTALTDDVTFTGAVDLHNNVTVTAGGGAGDDVTFTGAINADDAVTNDRTLVVNATNGTAMFASIGTTQALADFDVTAATIKLNGGTINVDDEDATAQTITLSGAVVLGTSVAIDTDRSAGTDNGLTITGTINASTPGIESLTATAGGADIKFDGQIGNSVELNDIVINSANNVTATNTITAGSFIQNNGTGTTNLQNNVDVDDAGPNFRINTATIDLDGNVVTNGGSVDLDATTLVDLAAGKSITTTAAVDSAATSGSVAINTSGTGSINLSGNIITTGAANTLGGFGGNGGSVTIATTDGDVTVADINTSGGASPIGTGGNAATITITAGDAGASGGDDITIGSLTALGGTGLFSGVASNVKLTATGGAIVDGNAATSNIAANLLTISASAGVGSGNSLETNVTTANIVNNTSGTVEITETNDLALDQINNGTRDIKLSVGGALTDGGDVNVDLVGGLLTITAVNGVGTQANGLETTATTLDITNSTLGDIRIDETDGVDINRLDNNSAAGYVELHTTTGNITVVAGQSGVHNAGTNWIWLDANFAGSSTSNLNINDTVISDNGDIFLYAGHDVVFDAGGAGDVTSNSGTGLIQLLAGWVSVGTLDLGGSTFNAKTVQFLGSGANDTLIAQNVTNNWQLTGPNIGNLANANIINTTTGSASFSNFSTLTGGTASDTLTVSAASNFTIDGNGTNTADTGTVTNLGGRWSGMENLVGSTGADNFIFTNDGSVSGKINGGDGVDILDYTSYTGGGGTVTVDLTGAGSSGTDAAGSFQGDATAINGTSPAFDNINGVLGTSGKLTLTGLGNVTVWQITDLDTGNADGFSFSGVSDIAGGNSDTQYYFIGTGHLTGSITDLGGNNTLFGNDNGNSFTIDGNNQGTLDTIDGTWSGIQNLVGGLGDDSFEFDSSGSLSGTIDGGAGVNEVDIAAVSGANSISLLDGSISGILTSGMINIQEITGDNTDDVLVGFDAFFTWNITGVNDGNVGGVEFTDIPNLSGGNFDDFFNFFPGGSLTGTISGGGQTSFDQIFIDQIDTVANTVDLQNGTISGGLLAGFNTVEAFIGDNNADTIIGTNVATTWSFAFSDNGAFLDTGFAFRGFPNVTGGTGNDVFLLNNFTVTGAIDGGAGTDTLDYSAGPSPANVVLTSIGSTDGFAGTATNVTGGFDNIDALTGSGADDTLTGLNAAATWDIAGVTNTYTSTNSLTFTAFRILSGGTGSDTFNITGVFNGNINGNVNGAPGPEVNTFNLSGAGNVTGTLTSNSTNPTTGDILNFSKSMTGTLNILGNATWNALDQVALVSGAGSVTGSGNIIVPVSGDWDIYQVSPLVDSTGNDLNLNGFMSFGGHLVIGGTLDPIVPSILQSPTPTITITAGDLTLNTGFCAVCTSGNVTLLGANIILPGAPDTFNPATDTLAMANELALIAIDTGPEIGNIDAPSGPVGLNANRLMLIAEGDLLNSTNINVSGGTVEIALGNSSSPTVELGPFTTSTGISTPEFDALVAALNLQFNLNATTVTFISLTSFIQLLEQLGFIDTGLFEQDLTLFGVIGNGIALALSQCEEVEGCAPNVTEEELNELIAQLEARIEELTKRCEAGDALACTLVEGFKKELANFHAYRAELRQYTSGGETEEEIAPDEFGGEKPGVEIENLAKVLEGIKARISWLESLKGDPEARARLTEKTGIELTQEALDAMIEGAKAEAKSIEKRINLLQEKMQEAALGPAPLFIAEAGDYSRATTLNYGPSLLDVPANSEIETRLY